MTQNKPALLHRSRSTLLTDIANLASPSAAPRTIRFSEENARIFQIQYALSFPGGRSKEQGGTIVADADGNLSVQNIGGLSSDASNFDPNLMIKEPAKYSVVGTLHTHAYDKTEGSYAGVSFSGIDVAHLLVYNLTMSILQSGPRLFVLLRTMQSPAHVDHITLGASQTAAVHKLQGKGRTFQQATRIQAEVIAPKYRLAYYQGANGVVTRVSPR